MKRWVGLFLLLFLPVAARATQNITFVNSAVGTTSATVPAYRAGDLFIGYAYRNNSNTPPTLPAGWTAIHNTTGTGTNSDLLACKVATGDAVQTATGFTNATGFILLIYRGVVVPATQDCASLVVGGFAADQSAGSATISYGGATLTNQNNTSWVIGCAGSVTATDVNTAPTGMTNRAGATSNNVGCADTNSTTSTWTTQTVGVNASASWQSFVFEIRACTTQVCKIGLTGVFAASATNAATPAENHLAGQKLLVLLTAATGNSVTSVTNTAGDTFARCTGAIVSGGGLHSEIWETTSVPNGNASDIVTGNWSGVSVSIIMYVLSYSGLQTGACETSATGSCTACSSVTSGSFSTAIPGNYNIAAIATAGAGGVNYTAGTGYELLIPGTPNLVSNEQRIGAPAGSQTASLTASGLTSLTMSVASFKTSIVPSAGGIIVGP